MVVADTGISSAYFPQFAMMGMAMPWQSPGLQPAAGYQSGGVAIAALSSSRRLDSMFTSLTHGTGCFCCCCSASGVAFGCAMAPRRIDDDPYGISQSGQGLKSNLANSPEVMLAIKDIMSGGKSLSFDDIQKQLKEKYGIEAEVGDIETKSKDGKTVKGRALKFANGDYFVDGNGNGSLDAGDYKFDDAIKNIKEKYGLDDDAVKRVTEQMKAGAGRKDGMQFGGWGPRPSYGIPGLEWRWMALFAQAWSMAA